MFRILRDYLSNMIQNLREIFLNLVETLLKGQGALKLKFIFNVW